MNLFTSESVTKGHPDKICDQIADRILDECLSQDKNSHVACEVCCTTGTVVLMGEITTNAQVDYKKVARDVLKEIGYTNPDYGIDAESCSVMDLIDKQSPEINNAVNNSLERKSTVDGADVEDLDAQGAGDQGIIFGYACNETKNYMPLTIYMADMLARRLERVREEGIVNWLRPDGKTQVTVKYDGTGKIVCIDTILISTQHNPGVWYSDICDDIIQRVITPVIKELGIENLINDLDTKFIINPSGSFTIGGPHGDTGLTGRKLAVDTYGGHAKFGGGAMSGKCPSKVDRSAAYMARYVAKHVVASGIASKCEIQVSYAIGQATPVSINVDTFGTSVIPSDLLCTEISRIFDFRPLAIIKELNLLAPQYYKTSSRCHFGNTVDSWEILNEDKLQELKDIDVKYKSGYVAG